MTKSTWNHENHKKGPGTMKSHKNPPGTIKTNLELWKTMKTNLELYRVVTHGYRCLKKTPRRKWSFFVTKKQTLHHNISSGEKNIQYFHLYFLKDTLRWDTILSWWKAVLYWRSKLKINILLQNWMFCFKVLIWRLIERKVGFLFWSQRYRWREGCEHLKGSISII